jgi:hypothetical protein
MIDPVLEIESNILKDEQNNPINPGVTDACKMILIEKS